MDKGKLKFDVKTGMKNIIGRDLITDDFIAIYELVKNSVILLEQIRTIDKRRLKEKICHLDDNLMAQVDKGIKISFALNT